MWHNRALPGNWGRLSSDGGASSGGREDPNEERLVSIGCSSEGFGS